MSKPDTDCLDRLEEQCSKYLISLIHWESHSQIQPNIDALSVDNQDTWLGIVVSEDHVILSAISVPRKNILYNIAGSRETTMGISLPIEQEIFPSFIRCLAYRVCTHIIRYNQNASKLLKQCSTLAKQSRKLNISIYNKL